MSRRTIRLVAIRSIALALGASGCAQDLYGILAVEGTGTLLSPPMPRGEALSDIRERCGAWVEPGGDLARLPYVQSVASDRARVSWTSRAERSETLELWAPGGDAALAHEAELEPTRYLTGARQWGVALEGLEPDRVHCYRLRDASGTVIYGPSGFRTAPRPGEGVARLVVFGDSGSGSADQAAVAEQIATVPHDAVLHTGDLAYENGTLAELEAKHFAMYAEEMGSVPFFTSLGDHDHASDAAGPYREAFTLPASESGGERWYSFDWGPVHVVVLDSNTGTAPQRSFLERDLAANTEAPWTIVVVSAPLYSSGFHGGSGAMRDAFEDTMIVGGVDLVLSGDDHDYERTEPIEGVTYVVTGGGGRSVRTVGRSSFTAFSATAFHFVAITATSERLRVHGIDATGREFDGTELTR